MSFTAYEISVPVLTRARATPSDHFDKTSADAAEPAVFLASRFAPDMLPLSAQVQRSSDNAKNGIARLAGIDAPSFPDTEATFDELKARLGKTIAFLETITPEQLDVTKERTIELRFRSVSGKRFGDAYLLRRYCRTSSSTAPPPTTSCATTASMSARRITTAPLRRLLGGPAGCRTTDERVRSWCARR